MSLLMRDASSEGELVRLALEGDEHAFGSLVELYQRAAYAVAYSVIGRHEDAEDVAQESFLVALERLEECRNPTALGMVNDHCSKSIQKPDSTRVLRETDEIPMGATS